MEEFLNEIKPYIEIDYSRYNDEDGEEILNICKKYKRSCKKEGDYHYYIALGNFCLDQYKEAGQALDKAMKLNPKEGLYYILKAEICKKQGESNLILQTLESGSEVDPGNTKVLFAIANYYNENKDYQQVLINYQRAIKADSNNPEIYLEVAEAYAKLLDFEKSVQCMSVAIKLDSMNPDYYFKRGEYYSEIGDLDKAAEDYLKTLNIDQNYSEVFYAYGDIYMRLGNFDQAIDTIATYVEREPGEGKGYVKLSQCFLEMGNIEKALNYINEAINLNPMLIEPLKHRAKLYEIMDKPDFAVKEYLDILEKSKENLDVYIQLGRCYFKQDMFEESIEAFTNALELNPESALVNSELGTVYYTSTEYNKAIEFFTKAIELEGDLYDYTFRGRCYYLLEDYDSAESDFKECLKENPEDDLALYFLGHINVKRENYEEGEKQLKAYLMYHPDDFPVLIELGKCYAKLGDGNLARYYFYEAEKYTPVRAELYNEIGYSYYLEGALEQANKYFDIALREDPDYAVTYCNKGLCFFTQNNLEYALECLNKALELNPDDATVLEKRISILIEVGQFDLVEEDLLKLVGVTDKKDGEIYSNLGWICYLNQKYKKALKYLKRAILFDKSYFNMYYKGVCLFRLGEYAHAERELLKVLNIKPGDPNTLCFLGYTCTELKKHDKAMEYFELYLKSKEGSEYEEMDYEVLVKMASIYESKGRLQEARKYLIDVAKYEPLSAYAFDTLGNSFFNNNEFDLAKEYYEKAIQFNQEYASAYCNRGWVSYLEGDYDIAVKFTFRAVQLQPDLLVANDNLAMIYLQTQDYEAALEFADRAIIIDESNGDSYVTKASALYYLGTDEECKPLLSKAMECKLKNYNNETIKELLDKINAEE